MQEPLRKGEGGALTNRIDLTPAEAFGEIHYLLGWSDLHKMTREQVIWKLRRTLADYSDADYLLMLGSPSAMWLSGAIAAENNEGVVRTLEWDNKQKQYSVVVTNLNCQPA